MREVFMRSTRFLHLVSAETAAKTLIEMATRLPEEMVPLEEAGGRVLANPVVAQKNSFLSNEMLDEEISEGETVFSEGTILSAREVGGLAALCIDPVPVVRRPRIGVISTGNELVPPASKVMTGQIRDANSTLLISYLRDFGAIPVFYGIVPDVAEKLTETLRRAAEECDLVVVSGGSSKDERDVTAGVIAELGSVRIHGVSVAPGKPLIIGTAKDTPVIGLPGNPASVYMITQVFVTPMLRKMTGEPAVERVARAVLSMSFPSERGREDLVRVKFCPDGSVEPCLGKSGLLNTLVHSDGYLRVPAGVDGYEAGEEVQVHLWQGC